MARRASLGGGLPPEANPRKTSKSKAPVPRLLCAKQLSFKPDLKPFHGVPKEFKPRGAGSSSMPRLDSQEIEQLLLDAQGWENEAERLEKDALRRVEPAALLARRHGRGGAPAGAAESRPEPG